MKKAINEFEDKIVAHAHKELEKITGITDWHGMHSTVYSYIKGLIDAGKKLKELESLEYVFPDKE